MKRIKTALLCAIAFHALPALAGGDVIPDNRGVLPQFKPAYPYGVDPAVAAVNPADAVVSLEQAITRTYWSNPALLAQRATLRSVDALYPAARSAYGPQLAARGEHSYAHDRFEQLPSTWQGNQGFSTTASLIFTQPLFSFGRRSSAEDSATAQIAFGRDQLRMTEADIMLRAITAYVSVIRDKEVVEISRQNLDLLERQFKDNRERLRVREITSTDMQQVETRLEFGRAQYLSAQGQLGASQSQFLQVIGGLPGKLEAPRPLDLGASSLEESYAVAEVNSPVVRAAQSREKFSRAAIASARAEQLPDVTTQSSVTFGALVPYQNLRRTTEIRAGVVATMPLIDSGLRRARIEQATQANDADWRLLDQATRDTRQAVAQAWDAYTSSRASLIHYEAAVSAAQKAYEGADIQQRAGARTTLDVLDLARDLLTVRTNYATARANQYVASANLLAAMGRLEAPLLVPTVQSYDPAKNFERQRRRGDVPLLTPLLSGLDSIANKGVKEDRPIRDTAGGLHTESAVTYAGGQTPAAESAPVDPAKTTPAPLAR